MSPTLITTTILLIVFGVIIATVALLNRNKQLQCPDCEHTFNAPIMDQKLLGLGWTFPYMGTIPCPKCKNKRARRDYNTTKNKQNKYKRSDKPHTS